MLKVKFRFRPGHRDTFISTPPWRLQGLFLNLTDYCNLRCGYCHASFQSPPGFMPLDLVTRALDQAADLGAKDILLTGGEPFLHPDFEKVLAECHERTLGCKIATNGTFLDEAHVNVLLKNEVKSLQISLDTLDADIYAAIKGVKPNIHGKVIDGIRRCIKTNQLHIAVSSVADLPVMPGLIDLMSFCYNEYIDTFTLYHMIPYGRAMAKEAALAEADFIKALDELLDAFLKLPNHWAVDLGVPCSPQSSLFQKWRDKVDIKPIGCIAGKSSMTILASGEAVPCVCMEDKSFSCGNIKNMALSELWESPAMSLFRGEIVIPSCESCPSRQFCLGGCRTLACLISKQPHGPDPMCPYWKLS